jgi:hypothetical protein
MALKSSSPLNLAALRQDYSALPQIAAVKAQANQAMFNAIQSGLEKRKEKIEKKEKDALNERLLQDLIDSDPKNRILPAGLTSKELSKYIPLEETIAHRQALKSADMAAAKELQLRNAAVIIGEKLNIPPEVAAANPEAVVQEFVKLQADSLKGKGAEYKLQNIGGVLYRINVGAAEATPITQKPTASCTFS